MPSSISAVLCLKSAENSPPRRNVNLCLVLFVVYDEYIYLAKICRELSILAKKAQARPSSRERRVLALRGHRAAVRWLRALIARQYAALVASAAVEA